MMVHFIHPKDNCGSQNTAICRAVFMRQDCNKFGNAFVIIPLSKFSI